MWSPVFDTPKYQILALYFDFEGAKSIHILKTWGWHLEDAGDYWLVCAILIFIRILSLVIDTQILILKVQRTSMSFKSWYKV